MLRLGCGGPYHKEIVMANNSMSLSYRLLYTLRQIQRQLKVSDVGYRLSQREYVSLFIGLAREACNLGFAYVPEPGGYTADGQEDELNAAFEDLRKKVWGSDDNRGAFKLSDEGKAQADSGDILHRRLLDAIASRASGVIIEFCAKKRKGGGGAPSQKIPFVYAPASREAAQEAR